MCPLVENRDPSIRISIIRPFRMELPFNGSSEGSAEASGVELCPARYRIRKRWLMWENAWVKTDSVR